MAPHGNVEAELGTGRARRHGWGDVHEMEPPNWQVDLGLKGDDSLVWKKKRRNERREEKGGEGQKGGTMNTVTLYDG